VAGLGHIEVQPIGFVEQVGGVRAAAGVIGHQMSAAVAALQSPRHGVDDLAMTIALDGPIAAEDPDDRAISIAAAQPFAVDLGILRCENLGADAPLQIPLVTPGRQHSDEHPERLGLVHDVIDVVPVIVQLAGLHVRPSWIVVDQGPVAMRVWRVQTVFLGQRYGLYDGEALGRAIFQIPIRLVTIQPVKQFPSRVAKIEER